jgi:hypothetical protein
MWQCAIPGRRSVEAMYPIMYHIISTLYPNMNHRCVLLVLIIFKYHIKYHIHIIYILGKNKPPPIIINQLGCLNSFNWVSLTPTTAPGRVPRARWDRWGPRDPVAAAWKDSLYLGSGRIVPKITKFWWIFNWYYEHRYYPKKTIFPLPIWDNHWLQYPKMSQFPSNP